MNDIKLEVGKVYRTGANHLVAVRREISKGSFLCVREAGDYREHQIFREDGYPDQSGPVSDRFRAQEEVIPTPEVLDPRSGFAQSFDEKERMGREAQLKEFIAQEIRLAMQQETADSATFGVSGLRRAAIADMRAQMIMNAISFDIRQGHVTEIPQDHINRRVEILFK